MDSLFAHTRRNFQSGGLEDPIFSARTEFEHALASRISSERIYYRLLQIVRKNSTPEIQKAILAFADRLKEQDGLERFTYEVFSDHPAETWTPEKLEAMADFQKAHPTWWSQAVEAKFEALSEAKRQSLKDDDVKNRFDVTVGVAKGVYRFGKGAVEGLYGLIHYGVKFCSDEATRQAAAKLAGEWVWFWVQLQFGGPETQRRCLEKIATVSQALVTAAKAHFVEAWQKAEAEGKTDELIATWTTQGVLEIATFAIALLKGARAAKVASEAEGAATKLSSAAAKLEKSVPGEKAVAEILGEATSPAAHVEATTKDAASAWRSLEPASPTKTTVGKKAASLQKMQISKEMRGKIHRLIGSRAAKRLNQAPADVRAKIHYSLARFIESSTNRGGLLTGEQFLIDHPRAGDAYVRKAIRVLNDIKTGKGVPIYTTVGERFVEDSLKSGMKGPMYRKYVSDNLGRDNRFGSAKYYSIEEHRTSRLEVFPHSKRGPDGKLIQRRGEVPSGYSILQAEFRPAAGLQGDFLVVPSVRRPNGLNLIDLDATAINAVNASDRWNVK